MVPAAPFLSTLLHRAKAVVRRVVRSAAGRTWAATADRPISPVPRGLATGWMSARLRALSALMRRIEAGEPLDRPVRAPGAARGVDARAVPEGAAPEQRLPRGVGWMCAFDPTLREGGAAFAAWLGEPAMYARIQAAPEQMVRAIAPILNATGTSRPDWFPVLAKRNERRAQAHGNISDLGAVGAESWESDEADLGDRGDVVSFSELRSFTPPLTPPTREGGFPVAAPTRRGGFHGSPAVAVWTSSRDSVAYSGIVQKMGHFGPPPTHVHFVTMS